MAEPKHDNGDSRSTQKPASRYRVDMSREAWIVVIVVLSLIAVASLFGAVRLLIRVVRTRRMLGELGAAGKVAFYGAIIYTIFPVDLIPDPIYLDDMGVLAGSLFYLGRLVVKRRAQRGTAGSPGDRPRAVRPPVRR